MTTQERKRLSVSNLFDISIANPPDSFHCVERVEIRTNRQLTERESANVGYAALMRYHDLLPKTGSLPGRYWTRKLAELIQGKPKYGIRIEGSTIVPTGKTRFTLRFNLFTHKYE